MNLQVNLGARSYDIVIERGCLRKAGEYLNLARKVLVVTDTGVPAAYAQTVAGACREAVICTMEQGEEHKTLQSLEKLLSAMLAAGFSRKDCVVAVGGGICGDLAGFAAASYMRGIDFYNIPTTVLSQVDSSIGGKTAVNLDGIKNVVGAFHQPRGVLIDTDVLRTLPRRHISAGLAEALKMAVTFDENLFQIFEKEDLFAKEDLSERKDSFEREDLPDMDVMETVIERSLRIKGRVVEQDETEQGLRRVLNFGHTIGHGIESLCLDGALYHGECVAIGMLPMCSPEIRDRMLPIYEKLHLPVSCRMDPAQVCQAMMHDKKADSGRITIIETDRIGTFRMRRAGAGDLREKVETVVRKPSE